MKARAAILLAALAGVTFSCWSVRASRRPVPRPPAPTIEVASKPVEEISPPEIEFAPEGSAESDEFAGSAEREERLARLAEEYELQVRQLIASIDWTRPESRRRFPIEYELIRADYERAVGR